MPRLCTGLLKARQPVGMERVAHREGKRVVGQHGLDRIRQGRGDVLQKARGGGAGLLGRDPDHGFATEVIDGRKFEVISGISERRQILQVDVEQFARAAVFSYRRGFGRAGRGNRLTPCASSSRWTVP